MTKKSTPTQLEMLTEVHKILEDVLDGFEKQKQGHVFPQATYEKVEDWVNDHDFS